MDYAANLLLNAAHNVHFLAFFLLLLAGFNLPVSEDITIIISSSLAATVVPENTVYIFIGCFLGAYFSDIIAYMIGRYGIEKLRHYSFVKKLINQERVDGMKAYFDRYGLMTLFFGRFFPFGVRNVLFMTSGLIKLNLVKFLLVDVAALSITTTILFYLGYTFGKHYQELIPYINQYKFILLGVLVMIILLAIARKKGLWGNNQQGTES